MARKTIGDAGLDGSVSAAGDYDLKIPQRNASMTNRLGVQVTGIAADTIDVYATLTENPSTNDDDWVIIDTFDAEKGIISVENYTTYLRFKKTGTADTPTVLVIGEY